MTEKPHENLLATHSAIPPTRLPEDPAAAQLVEHGNERLVEIVRAHPQSSLCWAQLAEGMLDENTADADITAYAYARTGYHRGLDSLRKAGWRGQGPVPWEHEPNRGFLRCVWALTIAAERIGEQDEVKRCAQLLRDSSATAYAELSAQRPMRGEAGADDSHKGS